MVGEEGDDQGPGRALRAGADELNAVQLVDVDDGVAVIARAPTDHHAPGHALDRLQPRLQTEHSHRGHRGFVSHGSRRAQGGADPQQARPAGQEGDPRSFRITGAPTPALVPLGGEQQPPERRRGDPCHNARLGERHHPRVREVGA